MKKIYIILTIITGAFLAASCLENHEPDGLKNLRSSKAEYQRAEAAYVLAEAAYQNALAEYRKAETEGQILLNELQKINNQIREQDLEIERINTEKERLALVRDSIDTEIYKLNLELANAALEAEKERIASEIAKYEKMRKGYEAEIAEYDRQIVEAELEILNFRNQMELRAEQHKEQMYILQQATAEAEAAYKEALADIAASDSLLTDLEKEQLEKAIERVETARQAVTRLQNTVTGLNNQLLDLEVKYNYNYETAVLDAEYEIKTDSLALELTKLRKEQFDATVDGISTDNYLSRISDLKAAIVGFEEDIDALTLSNQELQKKQRLYQDSIDQANADMNRLSGEISQIDAMINAIENEFYNPVNSYSVNLPADKSLAQTLVEQMFVALKASNFGIEGLTFDEASGRWTFPAELTVKQNFQFAYNALSYVNNWLEKYVKSDNEIAQLTQNLATFKGNFNAPYNYGGTKELYDTTLNRYRKSLAAYQKDAAAYRMGQGYDLQAEVQDAYDEFTAIATPTDAQIQAILDAVKEYVELRFSIENYPTPDLTLLTLEQYKAGSININDYINYNGTLAEATCLSGGSCMNTKEYAQQLWGYSQRNRVVELDRNTFGKDFSLVVIPGAEFSWNKNSVVLVNAGDIRIEMEREGMNISGTTALVDSYGNVIYNYFSLNEDGYWIDCLRSEILISTAQTILDYQSEVREYKAYIQGLIDALRQAEADMEASLEPYEQNKKDKGQEQQNLLLKIADLRSAQDFVNLDINANIAEQQVLRDNVNEYNNMITVVEGLFDPEGKVQDAIDIFNYHFGYQPGDEEYLEAEDFTEKTPEQIAVICEMMKTVFEDQVIIAQETLLNAKADYEKILNGLLKDDDDSYFTEKIADLQARLDDAKAALGTQIAVYEQYVKELNSLLALLFGE